MGLIDDLLAGRTSLSAGSAAADRGSALASDWISDYLDPNALASLEGPVIGARSEDALRNNPIVAAIVDTTDAGTLGERGLLWRSLYARDDAADNDEAEQLDRDRLTALIDGCTADTRFDAGSHRTWRELQAITLKTCLLTGNAFAVRLWKSNRPGRITQATCVRLIHPARVCNPEWGSDTTKRVGGVDLDDDGNPIAIHVRRTTTTGDRWTPIPIHDATGVRQVTWLKRVWHPDQIFGTGWLGPILPLLRQLNAVNDAYVVAKRIQACFPIFLNTEDPDTIKRAAAAGTLVGARTKLRPGQIWVGKSDTTIKAENLGFNGADHQAFNESLLQMATAAIGLPYEVVLNRLNKSNLAAARAALMAAYRAYRMQQQAIIDQVLTHWIGWMLDEAQVRGDLDSIPATTIDRLHRGKWLRPAIPTPDFKKDVDAAAEAVDRLKVAPSTALAMIGIGDHDTEIRQHARDLRHERAQGIERTPPVAAAPVAGDPTDPTEDPIDPTDTTAPGDLP